MLQMYTNGLPERLSSYMNMVLDDDKLLKQIVSNGCHEELQKDK